jgi:putative transposase
VYLYNPETGSEARERIGRWLDQYNNRRPHSTFRDSTPMEVYRQRLAA